MASKSKTLTYSEKLRDPRWQKMRLQIMERDKFTCQKCRSTTKTLNVHHTEYRAGCEPWGYPQGLLVTLCEDCHKGEHKEPVDPKEADEGRRLMDRAIAVASWRRNRPEMLRKLEQMQAMIDALNGLPGIEAVEAIVKQMKEDRDTTKGLTAEEMTIQ